MRRARTHDSAGGVIVFVVTNRIPVARGQEAAFEERFRNRAHLIDQSPGFIKNLVLRPVQRRFSRNGKPFLPETW